MQVDQQNDLEHDEMNEAIILEERRNLIHLRRLLLIEDFENGRNIDSDDEEVVF